MPATSADVLMPGPCGDQVDGALGVRMVRAHRSAISATEPSRLGLGLRGEAVDQTYRQSLLRLHAAGGEDHLLGRGGSHRGHQVAQAIQRIGEAQPRRRQREEGGGVSHPQVAGQGDGQSAADAEALHHGDHRPRAPRIAAKAAPFRAS